MQMAFDQIVTTIALILGPVLAVIVSQIVERNKVVRNKRLWLFETLMANHADKFNPERIKALALIDVFFRKVPAVRACWKEYHDALSDPTYNDGKNNGVTVWTKKENVMLSVMASSLGFGSDITYEELERAYAPKLYTSNAITAQKTATEWLRVLENSDRLGLFGRKK